MRIRDVQKRDAKARHEHNSRDGVAAIWSHTGRSVALTIQTRAIFVKAARMNSRCGCNRPASKERYRAMKLTFENPAGIAPPRGAFSHVAALGTVLRARGATARNVVKLTLYVVDVERNLAHIAAARNGFVGDARPASTIVGVAALADPDWLFEAEAIAVVG